MTEDPDIVIVGSGAAGIGAARQLAGTGLSVVMLEALPRPGGRAFTRPDAAVHLDFGCGWLHSGDRNPWVRIAGELGIAVDRRPVAWGTQFRDLGFPAAQQDAARHEFALWSERVATTPPPSDIGADALTPGSEWTPYLQAMSSFISGDELQRISARDYVAYDEASTNNNWRVQAGYGTLIAAALPKDVDLRLATPVEAILLDGRRVALRTPGGTIRPCAVIVTTSTNVIAGDAIAWPSALDPWRDAARRLPLGANEKLFFEIVGDSPFETETHVLGDPHDASTGSYYIRPFGWPVIECFLGGAGARSMHEGGTQPAFARATEQLGNLFGSAVRRNLKPLVASDWTGTASIGGGYSHALPGQADARTELARPFDDRLFFAGEATHVTDFSTAHGALQSGIRAAQEAIAALTAARR